MSLTASNEINSSSGDDADFIFVNDGQDIDLARAIFHQAERVEGEHFGRSDNRAHLRRHFENDAESIAAAAISRLAHDGKFDKAKAQQAILDLGIDPDKKDAQLA